MWSEACCVKLNSNECDVIIVHGSQVDAFFVTLVSVNDKFFALLTFQVPPVQCHPYIPGQALMKNEYLYLSTTHLCPNPKDNFTLILLRLHTHGMCGVEHHWIKISSLVVACPPVLRIRRYNAMRSIHLYLIIGKIVVSLDMDQITLIDIIYILLLHTTWSSQRQEDLALSPYLWDQYRGKGQILFTLKPTVLSFWTAVTDI